MGCIRRVEAAPLVEVSMLRSREEVNIGCDREVSNERLSAEAMGGEVGPERGGHDQAREEVVVGVGGGRRLWTDMGGGAGAQEEAEDVAMGAGGG